MANQPIQPARERPMCVAVIICNEMIEDKRTNNKTLINLFNSIASSQLPLTQPRMVVMASLTNGIGRWPITFAIRAPSDKVVMRVDGEANFADPLAVLDIIIEFNSLTFADEGVHFVDVLTENYPLGNRRFTVQVAAPPGHNPRPTP